MPKVTEIERGDLQYGEKIGEGAYSTVYKMLWKSNGNKPVAVKKLNKIDKWELDILSELHHSNIVHLLGVVDEEMDFMLVLEYCETGSLRSYLDEHHDKPLTSQMFYDWAEQAAKPIQYLKQMCIVHKDIKSPNYLIADNGGLKLADFGIAKKTANTVSNATQSATAAWMAPELAKLGKLSPSYDIFALAVVLWELWTRESPFKGKDHNHIIWLICNENQRLTIPCDCPPILADLMKQCWESEWEKRPSIEEVLRVIKRAKHLSLSFEQEVAAVDQNLMHVSISDDEGTDEDVSLDILQKIVDTNGHTGMELTYQAQRHVKQPSLKYLTNITHVKQDIEQHVNIKRQKYDAKAAATPQFEEIGDWEFQKVIGLKKGPGQLSVPLAIAASSNGQCIAVVNMLPPRVNVYESDGTFKFSLLAVEESSPKCVAIDLVDNFFVSDETQSVKVYAGSGKYLEKLTAVSPDNKSSDLEETKLVGVAVNNSGTLLVGETVQKYISMHQSENRRHICSIRLGIEPLNIASSQDTIIISDCTTVQVVDYTGQVLHNLEPVLSPDDMWLPRGLCCSGDKILVCNYYSKQLCCFSTRTGDFIGSIPTMVIVSRDVAMTERGTRLIICALENVQVYSFD